MLITLLRRVAGPPGGVPSTTIQEQRGVTIAFPRRVALLSCVLGLPLGTACTPGENEPPFDMATYLEDAAANVDPAENRFANSALLRAMEVLPPRTNDRERLLLRLAIAEQTLYAGHLEAAIGLLESLRADVADHQASAPESERAPPSFLESLLDFLATAYLRLGERENCIDGVGAVACLVPVPAEGVHTAPRGARASIPIFEELLERNPDNLGARWMLNVAHMMLGTYPTDVPSELLIPELAFRSEHDIGRFRDVAPALGVDDVGHVGGGIMDDFNGDGLLDLMASSWQLRDPLRYHLNRGDGTFERLTGAAGLEGLWGGGNIVQADYDNDGDLDVFVLRGGWLVEGQVNGAIAQGIGQALLESMVYSSDGQPLSGSLLDYALPRATDIPNLETDTFETPSPLNPLGIKGVGELPTVASPVAVANAIVDALSAVDPHIDIPLTSEKIWRALHKKE